jgi:hypothetical protein
MDSMAAVNSMATTKVAIAAFVLLLAVVVAIRSVLGAKLVFTSSEILAALVPIGLWLFLTGKVTNLTIGGFSIAAAITEASRAPIAQQVTKLPIAKLPIDNVTMDAKGGVREIPKLVGKKTQALSFRLGHGGYFGPVIVEYFNALMRYPFLQYVVINNADGTFFGMADARAVAATIRDSEAAIDANRLADWLNNSNGAALRQLPGLVSASSALLEASDKKVALQRMDSLDVQVLPVIGDDRKFLGVVDRSKLSASMLVEIANRLEGGQ